MDANGPTDAHMLGHGNPAGHIDGIRPVRGPHHQRPVFTRIGQDRIKSQIRSHVNQGTIFDLGRRRVVDEAEEHGAIEGHVAGLAAGSADIDDQPPRIGVHQQTIGLELNTVFNPGGDVVGGHDRHERDAHGPFFTPLDRKSAECFLKIHTLRVRLANPREVRHFEVAAHVHRLVQAPRGDRHVLAGARQIERVDSRAALNDGLSVVL